VRADTDGIADMYDLIAASRLKGIEDGPRGEKVAWASAMNPMRITQAI